MGWNLQCISIFSIFSRYCQSASGFIKEEREMTHMFTEQLNDSECLAHGIEILLTALRQHESGTKHHRHIPQHHLQPE